MVDNRRRKNFYAISKGRCPPSIITTWNFANSQVNGFPDNEYKGFITFKEAKDWLTKHEDTQNRHCTTFHFIDDPGDGPKSHTSENGGRPQAYSVLKGRKPGVYAAYSEAKAQVEGYSGSTCKSHATVELAHASLYYAQAHCKSPKESTDEGDGPEDETILIKEMAKTTLCN